MTTARKKKRRKAAEDRRKFDEEIAAVNYEQGIKNSREQWEKILS